MGSEMCIRDRTTVPPTMASSATTTANTKRNAHRPPLNPFVNAVIIVSRVSVVQFGFYQVGPEFLADSHIFELSDLNDHQSVQKIH